jgi:hypothetical protein
VTNGSASSEHKLEPELDVTWVGGCADLPDIVADVLRAWRTRGGRSRYARGVWISEVWVVKQIESLSAELHPHTFSQPDLLD